MVMCVRMRRTVLGARPLAYNYTSFVRPYRIFSKILHYAVEAMVYTVSVITRVITYIVYYTITTGVQILYSTYPTQEWE